MKKLIVENVVVGLLVLAVLVAMAACHQAMPCSFFRFSTMKDTPARCIGYFSRPAAAVHAVASDFEVYR